MIQHIRKMPVLLRLLARKPYFMECRIGSMKVTISLWIDLSQEIFLEEIFNGEESLWWSKSGNYLAFTMIDDSNITSIDIPVYSANSPMPSYKHIPYPKAGTRYQPSINLFIWNKELNVTQLILVPDDLLASGSDSSYYLFKANWISLEADDGHEYDYLVAIWANRDQNTVYITVCQFSVPCRLVCFRYF